jgi:hypothetical protein
LVDVGRRWSAFLHRRRPAVIPKDPNGGFGVSAPEEHGRMHQVAGGGPSERQNGYEDDQPRRLSRPIRNTIQGLLCSLKITILQFYIKSYRDFYYFCLVSHYRLRNSSE